MSASLNTHSLVSFLLHFYVNLMHRKRRRLFCDCTCQKWERPTCINATANKLTLSTFWIFQQTDRLSFCVVEMCCVFFYIVWITKCKNSFSCASVFILCGFYFNEMNALIAASVANFSLSLHTWKFFSTLEFFRLFMQKWGYVLNDDVNLPFLPAFILFHCFWFMSLGKCAFNSYLCRHFVFITNSYNWIFH